MPQSKWLKFVKAYSKKHPDLSWKETLMEASRPYRLQKQKSSHVHKKVKKVRCRTKPCTKVKKVKKTHSCPGCGARVPKVVIVGEYTVTG